MVRYFKFYTSMGQYEEESEVCEFDDDVSDDELAEELINHINNTVENYWIETNKNGKKLEAKGE